MIFADYCTHNIITNVLSLELCEVPNHLLNSMHEFTFIVENCHKVNKSCDEILKLSLFKSTSFVHYYQLVTNLSNM